MICSGCFLVALGTIYPKVAQPKIAWTLSVQSLNKMMTQRFVYRSILWRYFYYGLLFPDNSVMDETDKNRTVSV